MDVGQPGSSGSTPSVSVPAERPAPQAEDPLSHDLGDMMEKPLVAGQSANLAGAAFPHPPNESPSADPCQGDPASSPSEHTPLHSRYTPQFASFDGAILQRLNQPASGPTAPLATMPMPAPSAPRPPLSANACSVCNMTLSSLFDPVVQCRRCDGCWHRLCHEPAIPDYAAASASWTCPPCREATKAGRLRSRHVAAVDATHGIKIEPAPSMAVTLLRSSAHVDGAGRIRKGVSWAHRPLHCRRAHVACMAPREMAYWLLKAVEQYPDFEMFPEEEAEETEEEDGAAHAAHATEAAPRPAPQYRNGIINSIRKSQAASLPAAVSKKVLRRIAPQDVSGPWFEATPVAPEEDPTGLMDGWPLPGRGLYAAASPDWLADSAVLADSSDHASFSSIVYDESGRKVRENGMPLLVL